MSRLIDGLPVALIAGSPSTVVADISEDSRTVQRGGLFIARHGRAADGRAFIGEAVSRGASAVLTEGPQPGVPTGTAHLVSRDLSATVPQMAERFFGHPSRALTLLGITGTKGKTTTAYLVRHLVRQTGAACGLMGTVSIDDGREERPASLTTPPAVEISRTLGRMVAHGCRVAVMECSSHALHQRRVGALRFAVGAFTNLTGDHLDYHETMDAYADAKALLFDTLDEAARAVVNVDDAAWMRMVRSCRAPVWRLTAAEAAEAEARAIVHSMDSHSTRALLRGPWGAIHANFPLIGRHNVANVLLAVTLAHAAGVDAAALEAGLATCAAPPGRLEPVTTSGDGLTVVVDYAHTDDALDKVLAAVRPITPEGSNLWVVFGCGGDRDRTKRPRMARIACARADRIVITSDNPRTEPPESIVEEILSGVPRAALDRVKTIVDRRIAIHHAIAEAEKGDVIVIAGKGHEDYQIIGATKHPFDDRTVAREALASRRGTMVAA